MNPFTVGATKDEVGYFMKPETRHCEEKSEDLQHALKLITKLIAKQAAQEDFESMNNVGRRLKDGEIRRNLQSLASIINHKRDLHP